MATVARALALLGSLAVALGCSSGSTATPPSEEASFAQACGTNRPLGTPPAPTTSVSGGGASHWYSIVSLSLGERDLLTSKRSRTAWQCYGFDLDGVHSDQNTDVARAKQCQRAAAAPKSMTLDGHGGIDNAFGHAILPILQGLSPCLVDASAPADADDEMLLRIDGDPTRDGANVGGALYVGRAAKLTPLGVGQAVAAAQPMPVATFGSGYVADGYWVSNAAPNAVMPTPLMLGFEVFPIAWGSRACPTPHELRLPIRSPQLAVRGDGTSAVLAGYMPIADLRASLVAWLEDSGVCGGSGLSDSILSLASQAPDLVAGSPTLQDATKSCDAVSIGLGLTLREIAAPPTLLELLPNTSHCQP